MQAAASVTVTTEQQTITQLTETETETAGAERGEAETVSVPGSWELDTGHWTKMTDTKCECTFTVRRVKRCIRRDLTHCQSGCNPDHCRIISILNRYGMCSVPTNCTTAAVPLPPADHGVEEVALIITTIILSLIIVSGLLVYAIKKSRYSNMMQVRFYFMYKVMTILIFQFPRVERTERERILVNENFMSANQAIQDQEQAGPSGQLQRNERRSSDTQICPKKGTSKEKRRNSFTLKLLKYERLSSSNEC